MGRVMQNLGILPCQVRIATPKGMDKNLRECKRRSDGMNLDGRNCFKEWSYNRQVLWMLFNEVDQGRRIQTGSRPRAVASAIP